MRISACTLMFGLVLAASLPGTALTQPAPADQAFRVTLLGTGTPNPSVERFGPSTLVEVGNQKLLFDVGRGATIRLTQLGVPLGAVAAVFVTHLHSDHVNGLSDLWLTGWLDTAFGRRTTPFRIFGPLGVREMMSYFEKAHQADIRIRMADEHLPASGIAIDATDVSEGVVYNRDGVRVTAFDVDHGEAIKPALGYRVDYRGLSVVMSGDTRVSTNLIKYAKGATVIVHEVMAAAADALARSAALSTIMAHHTSCKFPSASPRVALMDLNANALEFTARRIRRYRPEMYRRNVLDLEPIVIDAGKFDSVGISGLFHCLPGSIGSKAVALDYLKALMNPDGVLFGITILQDGVQQSWIARRMAGTLNAQGIFSNRHDYLDGLKSMLTERVRDVSIDITGCAALFSGRVSKSTTVS